MIASYWILSIILLLNASLGAAVQSAWSGHPQYVVIKSKEEKRTEQLPKEESSSRQKISSKPKKQPREVQEEYDDDDDYFNFEPPTEEEMQSIFESLSQVFAMSSPEHGSFMPPLS